MMIVLAPYRPFLPVIVLSTVLNDPIPANPSRASPRYRTGPVNVLRSGAHRYIMVAPIKAIAPDIPNTGLRSDNEAKVLPNIV